MTPAEPLSAAVRRLSLAGKFAAVALFGAVVALSLRLWPEWKSNPDLSHGFFMPLLFALLLYESRTAGTDRGIPRGKASRFALAALLGLALGALTMAGLYAAAIDWSHALVNVMLALSLVGFLGAGLVVFAGEGVGLLRLNWTAGIAIVLWLLATPIPPGTYTRLTLTLQLWVSELVLQSLHLLGIAAMRHGNLIDLATATVGVEEACSGVRSLISCVFAGLFFSATLVRRPWARALIIGLSAPLALLMNFIRSLGLTLLANAGIDIAGTWHDATGFAVLGVTAGLLGGLALLLERREKSPAPHSGPSPGTDPVRPSGRFRQAVLAGSLVVAAALAVFFVANTRPSPRMQAAAPDLFALLPASAENWSVKSSDLYEFRGTLKTDHLAQRHYVRSGPGETATEIIIYVAYWRAGQAPVSLVASHTPDACWPGAGWSQLANPTPRVDLPLANRTLADTEHRRFQADQRPQFVWFWHLYDGRPITYRDPYSALALLQLAWRYGFRRSGDQLFVRVSSNRPWSEIANEPILGEFFARTRALGL